MKRRKKLAVLLLAAPACVVLAALSAQGQDRVAGWRSDIDYLVQNLSEKHKDLFYRLPKEEFLARAERVREETPNLQDYQVAARLMRLVAAVGDGHTAVALDASRLHYLPLQFYWFREGLFIVQATADQEGVLGGRVTRIGDLPIAQVLERAKDYIASDNESQFRGQAPGALATAEMLDTVGAWKSLEGGALEIELNGARQVVECTTLNQSQARRTSWRSAQQATPFYARKSQLDCWNDLTPNAKLMFFKYNRCRNQPAFQRLVNGSIGYIQLNPQSIEGFVLDLRDNGGGDSSIFDPLYDYLKSSPLNEKGKLFVIIGRHTFSSAVLNALQMKSTHAIFVGEPTGGRPNHFGEVRSFTLPYSQLKVTYSTKYFRRIADSDPPSLTPDIEASPTFDDWKHGRDPALEAVVQRFRGGG